MAVQITIIGLGQIGGSIGLALAAHKDKIKRVGHNRDPEAARDAQKADAVDKIEYNLPASVVGSDVVVLAVPLNEVRDTLEFIRADLKEDAIVLDTSPAKRQGEAWARELLPAGRSYLGLFPAINPAHLLETGGGLDGAHADLFADTTCLVCPSAGLSEKAVRVATDFVLLLSANPVLSDALEADGLLSTMLTLPKLLAVSLVDLTMDKPGWKDATNLASRSYAMPVAATFDRNQADGLSASALANRDNLVRLLDAYIASLSGLREDIQNEGRDELEKKIRAAQEKALDWLIDRHLEAYRPANRPEHGKDASNPTSFGSRLRQSFLGSLGTSKRDE
jgi:prephenate dehydrogenase